MNKVFIDSKAEITMELIDDASLSNPVAIVVSPAQLKQYKAMITIVGEGRDYYDNYLGIPLEVSDD